MKTALRGCDSPDASSSSRGPGAPSNYSHSQRSRGGKKAQPRSPCAGTPCPRGQVSVRTRQQLAMGPHGHAAPHPAPERAAPARARARRVGTASSPVNPADPRALASWGRTGGTARRPALHALAGPARQWPVCVRAAAPPPPPRGTLTSPPWSPGFQFHWPLPLSHPSASAKHTDRHRVLPPSPPRSVQRRAN